MRRLLAGLLALAALTAAGCTTAGRNTRSGTLLGAAIGAGTGAIVGHQSGHRGAGAAIGAGIGALSGALVGNAVDRSERESAARTERALHEIRPRNAPTHLSILDVIRMSQAGLGDRVINAKIDQSGASFDLSTQDVIDLKRSGVSDDVIRHMLARPHPAAARYEEPGATRTTYHTTTYRYYIHPRIHVGFSSRRCR